MKLRIKGNSIRVRLSRSEINKFVNTGYLEDQTSFGTNALIYAVQSSKDATAMNASFEQHKITLFVPEYLLTGWPKNDTIGFNATMPLTGTDSLFLLLEKDFTCLDETTEDQSDNYENPNKNC
ncbi:hypothetical protein BH11BAC4_BH11BAC4_08130 [soil metagenome]